MANPVRGEVSLAVGDTAVILRPTFAALVAAEGEIGSLLALVDRAAEARVTVAEVVALCWHCQTPPGAVARDAMGDAIVAGGLAAAMPAFRALLSAIVRGQ